MARAIRITDHAVERYRQRVADLPGDVIRSVLSGPAVAVAAQFGARVVRMGRFRVLLDLSPISAVVVTVVPAVGLPTQLVPMDRGGLPPVSLDLKMAENRG